MRRVIVTLVWMALLLSACSPAAPAGGLPPPTPTLPPTATLAGAAPGEANTPAPTPEAQFDETLVLVTTTSALESGLLDVLVPMFEYETGYSVKIFAVNMDQAFALGESGQADVLLVHDPARVHAFVDAGFGRQRALVMHDDFVLLGPSSDPASVRGRDMLEALILIASVQARFVSRSDHPDALHFERSLWLKARAEPSGQAWYLPGGQDAASTLASASAQSAYVLAGRETFLASQQPANLAVLIQNDSNLLNFYHVVTVNPELHPDVNETAARAFLEFLTSLDVQLIIASHRLEEFGQPIFFADAGKDDPTLP